MSERSACAINEEDAVEAAQRKSPIIAALWRALDRLDPPAAVAELERLSYLMGSFETEPALTGCENAYWQCACAIADLWIDMGKYKEAYGLGTMALAGFQKGQERRAGAGLGFMGCSSTKGAISGTLASAKWLEPALLTEPPEPTLLLAMYESALIATVKAYRSDPGDHSFNDAIWNLEHEGMEVSKMLFADDSVLLGRALTLLEQNLGVRINSVPLHFSTEPSSHEDGWWYWDFEIAKMIIRGIGTMADYDKCHVRRESQFRLRRKTSQSIRSDWQLQRERFLRGLTLAPISKVGINDITFPGGNLDDH